MMANNVSRFRHAGLQFGPGWAGYDVEAMPDEQRAAIKAYLGRFIRVHPLDEKRLHELLSSKMPVPVNENREPDTARDESSEYAGMTVNDLRKLASELDVELPTTVRRKADIIKLLEEATGA